ncbi:N-acetyltransferase [Kribbella turkmenica]|uniref:N-acetyltransferase n=1 Tax=Kribbella turkmenica TaxID=2530375 RepID=A0A4R4WYP7_9ACTN|nr:GNAT family N-acetyltransferase [Kribbella turkmenica]TDD22931.1 N-acetyltransferase [Kribbella turkmenica]
MKPRIETERLVIRPWRDIDASDALAIYGDEHVTRWLIPQLSWVPDVPAMRDLLHRWQAEDVKPAGHWAVELRDTGRVVGGVALLRLALWDDMEIGWQLARSAWGNGYAAEAGAAVADWSMHNTDLEEVFALVGPTNARAAGTAKRIGMELIGETEQYHGQRLNLYRLRHYDLAYHPDSPTYAGET